jgi:hypothetical protein
MKKILSTMLLFLFILLTTFELHAQSAIFAGGPIYYDDYSIDELRNSGFTTVIVWTIHINENGDLNFNGEFLACKDGEYVGYKKYPSFPKKLSLLKSSPTSINRIEIGLSAWGSKTFDNVKKLVDSLGIGENTVLYKNFKSLLENIPVIDAVNFDDESTYDEKSATDFAIMLSDIGFKVTLAPYTEIKFWSDLTSNTNRQRPGTIDIIYLQCYDGGKDNNPSQWTDLFGAIPVHPGLWDKYDSPKQVKDHLLAWEKTCKIDGAFIWLYDDFKNSVLVADYANAINNSLEINIDMLSSLSDPFPLPHKSDISNSPILTWKNNSNSQSFDIYFGTNPKPKFVENKTSSSYETSNLKGNTTYYWKINTITNEEIIEGPIWLFTTGDFSENK